MEIVELIPALRAFARRHLRSEDNIDDLVLGTAVGVEFDPALSSRQLSQILDIGNF
ncbi:hypothetical protein RGR602_CH03309 [Rhizobium gallicum bv. gallicum R602sp]|uniref:Uncharacterized protein n=1 Tax=Rhizobium gallicum bv. gallicum R602sp TaxID=1041138 RepID=A0A0B4X7P0_9HYPH|nr:hypothetical protein RGR602_CH03309 [Rhizobium gallicum bv. gallicum R602sp]